MSAGIDSVVEGATPVRTVYLLHGILGSGRNWRSIARRWAQRRPDLRLVLVDQRLHGDAPATEGPHHLAACACDLRRLEAVHGQADAVVGHSFGGKVALVWASLTGREVWALDSPPGPEALSQREGLDGVRRVLAALRATPGPADDRADLRRGLEAAALPDSLVTWLLTSARRGPDERWRWTWDLDGIEALMRSYFATDAWPLAEAHHARLVRAERSDRWSGAELARAEGAAAEGLVAWYTLPNAGHWLHVDAPDALLGLLDAVALPRG